MILGTNICRLCSISYICSVQASPCDSASLPHKSSNQGRIGSETSRATIQQAFCRTHSRVIPIRLPKHPYFGNSTANLASLIPNLVSELLWLVVAHHLRWKPLHYQSEKSLFVLMPKIFTRRETTLLLHVLIKCGILDENL